MKTLKKISFFLPNFNIGGVEKSFINMANHFEKKGFKVEICFIEDDGGLATKISNKVSKKQFKSKKLIALLFELRSYFKRDSTDIFVTPMYMIGLTVVLSKLFIKNPPKIIIGARSNLTKVIFNSENIFERIILRKFSSLIFNRADKVICVSKGIESDLIENFQIKKENVLTIYNGILNENYFSEFSIPKFNWYQDNKIQKIITISRLSKEKCIDGIIRAFYQASNSNQMIRMLIIGEGPERENLFKLIKELNLEDKIKIINFNEEYLSFLSHSDLFILNSDFEGLPGILIEATALCKRVISRDCESGPKEILYEESLGKLYSHSKDLPDLILNELNKNVFKKNIDKSFYKKFSFDYSMENYLSTFNDLMDI